MKKTLLIAAIVSLVLCACTSPEKKAQKLIKEYLSEDLEFPKTYKAGEFGALEEVYSDCEHDDCYRSYIRDVEMSQGMIRNYDKNLKAYKDMKRDALKYNLDTQVYDEQIESYTAEIQKYEQRVKKYQRKADSVRDNFVPELIGYSMKHDYKYNNGHVIIDDYSVFIFDLDITTIVREE